MAKMMNRSITLDDAAKRNQSSLQATAAANGCVPTTSPWLNSTEDKPTSKPFLNAAPACLFQVPEAPRSAQLTAIAMQNP
eukprot:CAMPEP_0183456002 /NCGR_PEP_ID=MMETSP0370-20130417/127896_1 /TAXON_ID=268820 /ORGANISM="Peridinium aciculiferum, Strain PAER-2" /LENGTH=79 /DNA_ID=CAMNT_0025647619 /DNA_START=179 /DNA_END=414 /DNA_ORIENTATION=-